MTYPLVFPRASDATSELGSNNRLVKHISTGTLNNLPPFSSGPKETKDWCAALEESGVQAVNEVVPNRVPDINLPFVMSARMYRPSDAIEIAKTHKEKGSLATSLHVGTGFESDEEAKGLLSAIISASKDVQYPLFVETHRATLTQDMYRTLRFIEYLPDLRFNADLSHWYTGQSMEYGDFEQKLIRLRPLFERVRYIHGRIGTPCCMQVYIEPDDSSDYVTHFKSMWRCLYEGFLTSSQENEVLPFAAELLPSTLKVESRSFEIFYAHTHQGAETSDRWQQAEILWKIMCDCANQVASQHVIKNL